MDPAAPFQPAPGALIGGKYRLEAPLARGGMGAVWLARHTDLGVEVAVKFMDAAYAASPTLRSRFAREAKAAASLRNKHIVDVRDYGLDGAVPYIVMELLRGEDLGARLHREKRLTLGATAAIITQVAKALRGAHETGLVHRDLKPGNIFLAVSDDEEVVVKVLDFGIAKDTTSKFGGETTATGEVIGSPHYMSPEQIRGARDLDPRSDVWALGVIVFRCLTGRLPFDADAVGAIIGQILADPIPVATQVSPDLLPSIDAFFAKALVRDKTQRFASARDISVALSTLAGMPGLTENTFGMLGRPDSPPAMPPTPVSVSDEPVKTLVMTPTPVGSKSAGTFSGAVTGERPKPRPAAWIGAVIAMLSVAGLGALFLALRPGATQHAAEPPAAEPLPPPKAVLAEPPAPPSATVTESPAATATPSATAHAAANTTVKVMATAAPADDKKPPSDKPLPDKQPAKAPTASAPIKPVKPPPLPETGF